MKKRLTAALCTLLFFVNTPMTVFADGYNTVTAEIPVSCYDTGYSVYEIRIEPENRAPAPSPETLLLSGSEAQSFYIEVNEPGTYLYQIYEHPGTDENIEYDETIYHLTVYVEKKTESELVYAVTLTSDKDGHKPKTVEFHNQVLGFTQTETTPETMDDWFTDINTTTSHTTAITDSVKTDINTATKSSANTTTTTQTVTTETTETTAPAWYEEFFTPLTGDKMPIGMLLMLLCASGSLAGLILLGKQKRREETDDEDKTER